MAEITVTLTEEQLRSVLFHIAPTVGKLANEDHALYQAERALDSALLAYEDYADEAVIDATCDEIADLLGVASSKIEANRGTNHVNLTHAQARRLMVLARKA